MSLRDTMNRAAQLADAMFSSARTKAAGESLVAGQGAGSGQLGSNTIGIRRERLRHFIGWQAAVIRVAAQKIASQPLLLARTPKKGSPKKRLKHASACVKRIHDEAEMIDSHPILDVLNNPNDLMDYWSLIFLTLCSLELEGESYWWICRDDKARPYLWYLSDDWVQPVHTEKRLFDSYKVLVYGTGHSLARFQQ